MEDNLESKTKKYITSLLTSTPLVVTLHQLAKDYANTIGEPIPYQKMGYNSLEHFLRSIPDTVNVRGSGSHAEIVPVVSMKSAHVFELVANQKVAKPRRRPGVNNQRRRQMSYGAPRVRQPIYENPKPAPVTRKIFYPQGTSTPSVSSSSSHMSQFEYYSGNAKIESHPKVTESASAICHPKPSLPDRTARIEPVTVTQQQTEKKLVVRPKFETKHSTEDRTERNAGVQSMKCTTNVRNLLKKITPDKNKLCTEELESNVPYVVRSNLKSLISQCPKGIWCADVPEKYRRMFRQELNYQELGFRSLIDLCVHLSSIFHYVRPSTEDFKLYDRSQPLPDCAEKKFTFASYNVQNALEVESAALPNIDWADVDMFLPKDILKPGVEIPRAFIPMEMADYDLDIDIVVGEIYDLSKFWIYLQDTLLDNLMDDMQDFYKENALEYQIPEHLIKEGLYCVQVIYGEYHRALIVDAMPEIEGTIRVIFIDYGTMTKVPMEGTCFLHKEFSHLPAQAIRCRLANVFPLEEGVPWSREASRAFRKMVVGKNMSIKISHINWEDQFLEVYLADVTDENNIFYVNDRLVEDGFAQYPSKDQKHSHVDPIYTPIVKYLHLFPTFLELEHGLAPSTLEMEILTDCDVPINFCYPQYFSIDYSAEEETIKAAEEFHEKNCIRRRQRVPFHFYDREKFKLPELDLSIFGELEAEITEFLDKPTKQVCVENNEDSVDVRYEEDFHARLDVMTEKFKYLSTKEEEAVSVLKEDLQMTENIMKDINSLCQYEDEGNGDSECHGGNCDALEEDYYGLQGQEWELCTIQETRESDESIKSCCEQSANRSAEDADYNPEFFSNHPLATLRFKRSSSGEGDCSSSDSPQSEHSPIANNAEYDLQQPNVWLRSIDFSFLSASNTKLDQLLPNNDTLAPDPGDGVTTEKKWSSDLSTSLISTPGTSKTTLKSNRGASTNPFLEDESVQADTNTDLPPGLKLNPNNPFLTFLSNKNEEVSSESSQGSSASTVYNSPIVQAKTTHSWANFSDLSAETISVLGKTLSSKSSCNSVRTSSCVNNYSIATQTTVPPPSQIGPMPYYGQQQMGPYNYSNWSTAFANPYYNVRSSNYPSYPYDSAYGGMQPCFRPPPGFAPLRANAIMPAYPPRNLQDPTYYPRPLPYYVSGTPPQQGAAIQVNGASRAASSHIPLSVVSDNKDFYDVYNERLKLQVENNGQ